MPVTVSTITQSVDGEWVSQMWSDLGPLATTVAAAVIVGLLTQGLLTWRRLGTLSGQVAHMQERLDDRHGADQRRQDEQDRRMDAQDAVGRQHAAVLTQHATDLARHSAEIIELRRMGRSDTS